MNTNTKLIIISLFLIILSIPADKTHACPIAPVADLTAEPNVVCPGDSITFIGSGSSDSDGTITKYEWDFTNDGTYDYNETSGSAGDGAFDGNTPYTYTSRGAYTVKLRVTDNDNLTDTDTYTVAAGVKNITQNTYYGTIQAALDDANNGDIIEAPECTYYENNIDFNGVACTVRSTDADDWDVVAATIIDGNDQDANVVFFDSNEGASSVLTGFTITGGTHGIDCNYASPTISKCVITDNNCAPDCNGGGISCRNSAAPAITDCIFTDNRAYNGGGLCNYSSSPNITDCIFWSNTAIVFGGGMFNKDQSSPTVTNCVFSENEAIGGSTNTYGGGISNYGSNPILINCTFSKNIAHENGGSAYAGGMFNYQSDPNVINCVLWGNGSDSSYDEIYNWDGASDPNFKYCDIEGCGGSSSWYSNYGDDGGGNIEKDPNFVDADDTAGPDDVFMTFDDGLLLQSDGGCTDAADGNAAPSTDIMDRARIDSDRADNNGYGDPNYVDIGAYEAVTIWFVDKDATAGANDGTSWTDAYIDLQDALSSATDANDQIWVAQGTYKPDGNDPNNRNLSFELVEEVAVYGGFNATETNRGQRSWTSYETILTGDIGTVNDINDNSLHVVNGAVGAVLDGFTVSDGDANGDPVSVDGGGGGILCENTSPTIRNCLIKDNQAVGGAGMSKLWNCTPVVINCVFYNNTTINNGGGAGIGNNDYYANGGLTVTNCVFTGNSADNKGGAISSYRARPTTVITNCTFSGNSAEYGGAMRNSESTILVYNCIFWGNDANTDANEIYNELSSDPSFRYCDIAGCGGSAAWDSNFGTDGGGNIDGDPIYWDSSDPCGPDGVFCTFDDGLQICSNSPCIDAADGDAALSTDIIGKGRIDIDDVNNTGTGDPNYVDIGAYEAGPFTVHFSDLLIADNKDDPYSTWYSIAFVDDSTSDILGPGDYNETNDVLPGVLENGGLETMDGIVIHAGVRLIIYKEQDFNEPGGTWLDKTGPAVITNAVWEGDSGAYKLDDDWLPKLLQLEFPQSVREWSDTDMGDKYVNYWTHGSFKIIKVK